MAALHFTTVLCLGIQLLNSGSVQGCNIIEEGLTWTFDVNMDEEIIGVLTSSACSEICMEDPECQGYTWTYAGVINNCYKFKQLKGIHECENCFSGAVPEELEGSCVGGADDILAIESAASLKQCMKLCSETAGCQAATFWDDSSFHTNTCFLYEACEDQLPCEGCSSSRISCLLPNQCSEFKVLDEADRSTSNENGDCYNDKCFCDQKDSTLASVGWQGAGYYRFLEPAGTTMPESSPGGFHCGTGGTGYLMGHHPQEIGEEVNMTSCFDSSASGNCKYKVDITVTKCRNYHVYHLEEAPECIQRYCALHSN